MFAAGAGLQVATGDPGSAVFANIPTGNGTFTVNASAANAGTVVAGATSVSDPTASPPAWDGGGYSIVFTAADAYEVRDASSAVVDTGSYDPSNGGTISFRGAQIALTGTPAAGDSLAIAPSTKQDVFSTLQNLIASLQMPNGGGADMQNAMNAQLMNLDQAMSNVTRTRGLVGARMNALDQQQGLNNDLTLQYQSSLSDVQDVNYYDAVSQLNAQTTALQAAQLTFSKMQTSKLFDYLR
jgi:flagellar hook-associated protein 3 FlgL